MASKVAKVDPETAEGAEQGADAAAEEAVQQQLEKVQEKLFKLNEEASDKVLEIEQQYSKLRRPIYDERKGVLAALPQFWQRALLQHPDLRRVATEDDEAVLEYCTELDVEDFPDIKSGYRIVFRFSENPYFSNTELVKEFTYQEGGLLHMQSTKPQWKEGYEPAEDPDAETNGGGAKRPRTRSYKLISWFDAEDEVVPSTSQDDLAEIIKEDIWPDPWKLYKGEIEGFEGGEGEDDDEDVELEGDEFGDDQSPDEGEEGGEGEADEEQ